MQKFNVPNRKYAKGKKKMVSWRLNEGIIQKINSLAEQKNWSTTELVTTVLDQFAQWEEKVKTKK